jgi:predicted transcriptional regulator
MEQRADETIDARVRQVLTTAIREAGGPTDLVRRHDQGIIPALVESAYTLVLHEEAGQTTDQIARFLGISVGAVESIITAPMEAHLARMHSREDAAPEFMPHTPPEWSGTPDSPRTEPEFVAGALAKFAYDVVRRAGDPKAGRPIH